MAPQMNLFELTTKEGSSTILKNWFENHGFNNNSSKTIKDFGEKIGGAKKDLWKLRGMLVSDLDELTDREAVKIVVKNNIWPVPNYEEMVKEGMDPVSALLIKKIRDSLPAKVKITKDEEKNNELFSSYIDFLNHLKATIETFEINSPLDLIGLRYKALEGYYDFNQKKWIKSLSHVFTSKFLKALKVGRWDISKAMAEVERTNFPVKVESWRRGIDIKKSTSGDFFITSGREILAEGFSSKEEAEKHLEENLKKELINARKRKRGERVVRPQLKHIVREGKDFRNGKDVRGNDFLEVFNFRGGEFGNYTNQDDRQQYLNHAYDALFDLAEVLGIEPTKLSMGGKLGIAFGARGSGNAMAHYEPSNLVINLTKMRGAGSLAHEMGHALDDYLAFLSKAGTPMQPLLTSQYIYKAYSLMEKNLSKKVADKWSELLNVIQSKDMDKDDIVKTCQKQLERYLKRLDSYFDNILNDLKKETGYSNKPRRAATQEELEQCLDYMTSIKNNIDPEENFTKLNKLHKSIKRIMISKSYRDSIDNIIYFIKLEYKNLQKAKEGKFERKVKSDYLNNSLEVDKNRSKPYFSTLTEMFARAFESFVYDVLLEKGYRSDYLVYGVTNKEYAKHKIYPGGLEREKINKLFKEFIREIKPFL